MYQHQENSLCTPPLESLPTRRQQRSLKARPQTPPRRAPSPDPARRRRRSLPLAKEVLEAREEYANSGWELGWHEMASEITAWVKAQTPLITAEAALPAEVHDHIDGENPENAWAPWVEAPPLTATEVVEADGYAQNVRRLVLDAMREPDRRDMLLDEYRQGLLDEADSRARRRRDEVGWADWSTLAGEYID
ncbi:hypothetical protein C8R44DRAFT_880038 [Mycena epipterygia]|nr:hypothetical protein C8R44DRAFT_880038 [Mycena epipterygia]